MSSVIWTLKWHFLHYFHTQTHKHECISYFSSHVTSHSSSHLLSAQGDHTHEKLLLSNTTHHLLLWLEGTLPPLKIVLLALWCDPTEDRYALTGNRHARNVQVWFFWKDTCRDHQRLTVKEFMTCGVIYYMIRDFLHCCVLMSGEPHKSSWNGTLS